VLVGMISLGNATYTGTLEGADLRRIVLRHEIGTTTPPGVRAVFYPWRLVSLMYPTDDRPTNRA
jgi:hypothetical protein